MISPRLICIGASAGGISAVQKILQGLPANFSIPIVIVQHIPATLSIDLQLVFGSFTSLFLLEALDKMPIEKGAVYFAPGGYHLLIEKDMSFALNQEEPVQFSRPSIDIFFDSAVQAVGSHLCGILLTGCNQDGVWGMEQIQAHGGWTIVQDPTTAEYPHLPLAALNKIKPHWTLSLEGISARISEFLQKERS